MNTKKIYTSILTLILCFCLIAGSTFALFTSESKTDISVTSGTVDVDAAITLDHLYTPSMMDENGEVAAEATNIADTEKKTFGLGGTVSVNGGSIELNQMAPGDKAVFAVTMTNKSNVAFLQRMVMSCNDADKAFFGQMLIGLGDTANGPFTYFTDFSSAWEKDIDLYGESVEKVQYLSIEMPGHVSNKYQNKTCAMTVNVMAVQGNAETMNGTSTAVYMVNDQATLEAAVKAVKNGETIYVTKTVSEALTITTDEAKTFIVRGYHLAHLTVEAADATIHVYNNITELVGDAVAMESLHVYGEIGKAAIMQGRLVVENNAVIKEAKLAPEAGVDVVVIIPEAAENAEIGVVEKYVVDEVPADATASIRVPAGITAEVTGDGKEAVSVGSSSAIKDAETLKNAIADAFDGEVLKLAATITSYETLVFDKGIECTIDLSGNTLIIATEGNRHGMYVTNGSTLNLYNSIAGTGSYEFNCENNTVDAIYVENTVDGKATTLNIKNPVRIDMDITSGCAIEAQAPKGNCVVNIEDGTNITIVGQANRSIGPIYIAKNSTLNMMGGNVTIQANFDTYSQSNDACGIVLINDNAHAYITGGTFTVSGKNAFAQGIQIATYNGSAVNTNFVISNAEFNVTSEGGESCPFAIFDPQMGSGEIINATVLGDYTDLVITFYSGVCDIAIKGGTFAIDPTAYVAEGYKVVENNGLYTVVAAE